MTLSIYSPMLEKVFSDIQAFFDKNVPLEVQHKGAMHKMSKYIQETQGEVDCFA